MKDEAQLPQEPTTTRRALLAGGIGVGVAAVTAVALTKATGPAADETDVNAHGGAIHTDKHGGITHTHGDVSHDHTVMVHQVDRQTLQPVNVGTTGSSQT